MFVFEQANAKEKQDRVTPEENTAALIDCAGSSEKENVQKRLSLLKESIVLEKQMMEQLVTEADLPELLIDVAQVGLQEELSFEKFTPKKGSAKLEEIKSREISVKAGGKLEGITAFIKDISALRYPIGITKLIISKADTGAYKLDLTLYVPLNDLSVTNTNIGLAPFSRCVELFEESHENTISLFEEIVKSRDAGRLFDGFDELFIDFSGKIQLDSLVGNIRNSLRLTGKYYGHGDIKEITDRIEGFPLNYYSIQAISDHKEGRSEFSIGIALDTKTTQDKNRPKGLARNSKQRKFDKDFNAMLKRAESGDSENQRTVGLLYLLGKKDGEVGTDKNVDKGIYWLKKASKNKDSEAAKLLGGAYFEGLLGIPKNLKLAERFFVQAAELGDPEIQVFLGYAYAKGDGFDEDRVKAKYWLEKALDSGYAEAEMLLASLNLHDMQDPEYAFSEEGWRESRKLFEQAYRITDGKDTANITGLAMIYLHGLGGSKNEKKALSLYKEAYRLDPKSAAVELGRMHELGQGGLKASVKKAEKYYRKARKLESDMGAFYLGYLIERRLITPEGDSQSHRDSVMSLYDEAAKSGNEFISCYVDLTRKTHESSSDKSRSPSNRYTLCKDKFVAKTKMPLIW